MGNSMAVTEGTLEVGDKAGSLLDTTVVTQSDGTTEAHREAVIIADPEINGARAQLEGFPFGGEERWAIPITGAELKNLAAIMELMVEGQRLTHLYLSRQIGETLTTDDLEDY